MKSAKWGSKREKTITQSAWHMDGMTRTNTWANVLWHNITSAHKHEKKGDVWGVLFTHSIGCSRLLSAGNDPATTNQKFCIMSSTRFYPTAIMKNWKKNTDATFGFVEKVWVQVALLLVLSGDDSLMWHWFGSLIRVSSVYSCPICSVWDTNVFDISHIPHRIKNRSGFPVPIYPLRCTSPRSSQFWVANHDILNLVGCDREFHQISFWDISSARCGPQNALSVPQ